MPFYNREREIKEMKTVLSGEPNLVYFVYGPINSGKTAFLMKVFEELPENYSVFYINFRWRYVEDVNDLIQVLFRVKREKENLSVFLEKALKSGAKLFEKLGGIPIPEEIFDLLSEKIEDVFAFLKDYFSMVIEKGYKPVFVLDEMQTIKEVINASGRPIIQELFNFLVGMTKETHLCHSLCATSDCLFIENVYSNARLEGRAEYILVDDLCKKKAFRIYDELGFKDKELVWEYIGGKVGDMIKLFEKKKRILAEEDSLKEMLKDTVAKISDFLEKVEYGKKFFEYEGEKVRIEKDKILEIFRIFCEKDIVKKEAVSPPYRNYLVSENILFYNPVEGTLRPQSRLIQKAIRELV